MGQVIKDAVLHNTVFWICLAVSVLLLISGFVVPPTGVIDASVLKGVGELFGFAALGVLGHAIDKGLDTRIKHGDTIIEVGDLNTKEEDVD